LKGKLGRKGASYLFAWFASAARATMKMLRLGIRNKDMKICVEIGHKLPTTSASNIVNM
jgi:hypothetical protein